MRAGLHESATDRPSRAPSTTKSVISAIASGWLSLTPRSSRRRATIAAIAIRSLSFSRGVRSIPPPPPAPSSRRRHLDGRANFAPLFPEPRLRPASATMAAISGSAQSGGGSRDEPNDEEAVEGARAGLDALAGGLERRPQIGQARFNIGHCSEHRRQGPRARAHRCARASRRRRRAASHRRTPAGHRPHPPGNPRGWRRSGVRPSPAGRRRGSRRREDWRRPTSRSSAGARAGRRRRGSSPAAARKPSSGARTSPVAMTRRPIAAIDLSADGVVASTSAPRA